MVPHSGCEQLVSHEHNPETSSKLFLGKVQVTSLLLTDTFFYTAATTTTTTTKKTRQGRTKKRKRGQNPQFRRTDEGGEKCM